MLCFFLDRSLLVAVTGSSSGPGADVQTVSLSQCPGHEVNGLAVSRSGRWVSLWGERGVTLVQMPPRGGVGGRFGGGREELTARSQVRREFKCTVSKLVLSGAGDRRPGGAGGRLASWQRLRVSSGDIDEVRRAQSLQRDGD